MMRKCGRLAQLGERGVRNAEVGGSSPLPSTNLPPDFCVIIDKEKAHEICG